MWIEELEGAEYVRLEPRDIAQIVGRKVCGHGTVKGVENAVGERRPSVVHFHGGDPVTAGELADVETADERGREEMRLAWP